MERWLHLHLFKLGWLLTKDFRTTTVLFYALFLPGIVLHEVALFLAASFLNVRAERVLRFPQVQEIADLKINFIRLSPRAARWKVGLIEWAPPAAGVAAIAAIAGGVLDVNAAVAVMQSGDLRDVSAGFALLTAKPDFWLWTYLLFAIANTMTPRFTAQRALRPLIWTLLVAGVLVWVLGFANQLLLPLVEPVAQLVQLLLAVFWGMVLLNGAAIFVLGVIEQTIERVTGNSAEFVRGRLVAKTRAEILAERQAERQRLARQREAAKQRTPDILDGLPSVYRLKFPIPGPPEGRSTARIEPVPSSSVRETDTMKAADAYQADEPADGDDDSGGVPLDSA